MLQKPLTQKSLSPEAKRTKKSTKISKGINITNKKEITAVH